MRVLLINPSMNMRKLGRFANLLEPMPSIGIAYIAGSLEHHGCHVRAIDMFAEKLSGQEVQWGCASRQARQSYEDSRDTETLSHPPSSRGSR